MKSFLTKQVCLSGLYKFSIFFIVIVFMYSCKKDNTETNTSFLKGYWTYLNGAEVYYDGVSNYAKGTKVPSDNAGYNFEVGEDYWEDLRQTSDTTWTLNHIVRTSNGLVSYNRTTFRRTGDNTIMSTISNFGTETLNRRH